jgi:hypothetical protein
VSKSKYLSASSAGCCHFLTAERLFGSSTVPDKQMSRDPRIRDPYLVKAVVHSSKILSVFRTPGEGLRLNEIALRSGLPKTMAFRLLYTLEKCGMIEKPGKNLYRSSMRVR